MGRLRIPLETTLGAHSIPERIALIAKSKGFSVTHEKAGGWWQKSHLLVITGDDKPLRHFWSWVQQVVRDFEHD